MTSRSRYFLLISNFSKRLKKGSKHPFLTILMISKLWKVRYNLVIGALSLQGVIMSYNPLYLVVCLLFDAGG